MCALFGRTSFLISILSDIFVYNFWIIEKLWLRPPQLILIWSLEATCKIWVRSEVCPFGKTSMECFYVIELMLSNMFLIFPENIDLLICNIPWNIIDFLKLRLIDCFVRLKKTSIYICNTTLINSYSVIKYRFWLLNILKAIHERYACTRCTFRTTGHAICILLQLCERMYIGVWRRNLCSL